MLQSEKALVFTGKVGVTLFILNVVIEDYDSPPNGPVFVVCSGDVLLCVVLLYCAPFPQYFGRKDGLTLA